MNREDKIQKLAYKLYLKSGRKEGKSLDFWLHAERIVYIRDSLLKFIRHPLFLIIISGCVIWGAQQQYLKNQEETNIKFGVMKKISPIYASYYQETWNQWYAFRDKTPSEEYRRRIQCIVTEAKAIQTQLPLLFKDKKIYEDWNNFLRIFWEANYPISREGISEQKLNEKLNSVAPLIDDILNRMYKELR